MKYDVGNCVTTQGFHLIKSVIIWLVFSNSNTIFVYFMFFFDYLEGESYRYIPPFAVFQVNFTNCHNNNLIQYACFPLDASNSNLSKNGHKFGVN